MNLEGNRLLKKMWGILNSLGVVVELEEKDLLGGKQNKVVKNSRRVNFGQESKKIEIVIVDISSFDDIQLVADSFKQQKMVVVNCEKTEEKIKIRAVDFASGIVYGMDGSIDKIGDRIFLCAPYGVDIECAPFNEESEEYPSYLKVSKKVIA